MRVTVARVLRTMLAAVTVACGAFAAAAGPDYREGEVAVRYVPGNVLARYAIPASLGARVTAINDAIGWYTLRLPSRLSTAAALRRLHRMPEVQVAEPNFRRHPSFNPNDSLYAQQYGPQKIGCPTAWNNTLGASTITIAFIDTGIDTGHVEFSGRLKILTGCNVVSGGSDPTDTDGHGTHVAGIAAAATNNGTGIAGICQATIMPIKVFAGGQGGTIAEVAQAYTLAANNGADVINASLGGADPSQQEQDAVTYAISHGSIFVAAAGNNGVGSSEYPAGYPGVISVGASDANDAETSYTNYGPTVAVAAPGDKIVSTWINEQYATDSGTSMAAPHVSGALALLKSYAPAGMDPSAIKDALLSTTDPIGNWVRYGRININSAMLLIGQEETGLVTVFPTSASRFEGTQTGGTMQSFHAVDGDTANFLTSSPTSGIQTGSAQLEFLLATEPTKIASARFNFSAYGTANGTSMLYLYDWLKGRWAYVTGVAMTSTGNSIHSVALPTGLARYVKDGKLLAVLRGYLNAQANGGVANQFTYQIDLASLTVTLHGGP